MPGQVYRIHQRTVLKKHGAVAKWNEKTEGLPNKTCSSGNSSTINPTQVTGIVSLPRHREVRFKPLELDMAMVNITYGKERN
jgi:hypothetical protein